MKKDGLKEKRKAITVGQINDRRDVLKSQIERSVKEFFNTTGIVPSGISVECKERSEYVGPYHSDEPGARAWIEVYVIVDLRI